MTWIFYYYLSFDCVLCVEYSNLGVQIRLHSNNAVVSIMTNSINNGKQELIIIFVT